ncbi:MAG: hypothetical protein ACFFCO_11430, partial [Promethearchaeota archaeon]
YHGYDLDATAPPPGLNTWTVNDTANFDITNHGLLWCKSGNIGVFGVKVWVSDTLGYTLEATLTVNVLQSPPIPGFSPFAIVLGLLLALTTGILHRRKNHKTTSTQ